MRLWPPMTRRLGKSHLSDLRPLLGWTVGPGQDLRDVEYEHGAGDLAEVLVAGEVLLGDVVVAGHHRHQERAFQHGAVQVAQPEPARPPCPRRPLTFYCCRPSCSWG